MEYVCVCVCIMLPEKIDKQIGQRHHYIVILSWQVTLMVYMNRCHPKACCHVIKHSCELGPNNRNN